MSSRDLTNLLNMLSMLIENGMPLQNAIATLGNESSLRKHRKMLKRICLRLNEGSSLHAALLGFPKTFPMMVLQQVKLGESSGDLPKSLKRIAQQLEQWLNLRKNLIQNLSYPVMVVLAGSGLTTFMLTTVVPQFETVYADSQVSLPWVTRVVTSLSRTMASKAWLAPFVVAGALFTWL